jgi:hypothetical protein
MVVRSPNLRAATIASSGLVATSKEFGELCPGEVHKPSREDALEPFFLPVELLFAIFPDFSCGTQLLARNGL